jgi:hypothetical protein
MSRVVWRSAARTASRSAASPAGELSPRVVNAAPLSAVSSSTSGLADTCPGRLEAPSRLGTPRHSAFDGASDAPLTAPVSPARLPTPHRSAASVALFSVSLSMPIRRGPLAPDSQHIDRGGGERQAMKTLLGVARATLARVRRCGACGLPACTLQGAHSPDCSLEGRFAFGHRKELPDEESVLRSDVWGALGSHACTWVPCLASWGSLREGPQR